MPADASQNALLEPYVPRLVVSWLRESPEALWREIEGSLAFVDISGFTQLTEKLARKGKVGAEEMSDILNATFAELLEVAYRDGAGLVKWGGDAVLLLFEGPDHAARAARAAHRMRARMDVVGRLDTGSGRITLRMSTGIHSGFFHFFLVGDPEIHRELIISGPAASRCAEMEALADAGEVGLSAETVALLDPACVGETKGDGWLLAAEPELPDLPAPERPGSDGLDLASLLPQAIRLHVLGASGEAEHRRIAVAFVQFSGTDAMLEQDGPDALAAALDEAVRNVQEATTRHGVTFFESDINRDGGKIMLTAGAPLSADHDEERMLRATRTVVERIGRLPLRIGVNCGPVFSGDFGPAFRRTFSVKGDAINLAARVMGKAQPGQLLATVEVLERSGSQFDVEPLPPFMVKGKSMQIHAASVGRLMTDRRSTEVAMPLVGREHEMGLLRGALEAARGGQGVVVDLAGEPGIGKSRLVQELLGEADCASYVVPCDEYETATAYWPFRSLLRELLAVPAEAPDADVVAALDGAVGQRDQSLLPWLPLVAVVLDVDMPTTPQVQSLAEQFRTARLEEVTASVVGLLAPGPCVLVFDDVHLMDAASTGLLERMCQDLGDRPWLLLVTRRDVEEGFRPSDEYDVVPLRPAPLDAGAASALIAQELAGSALSPHDIEQLVTRAGGNPLFLRGLVLAARTGSAVDSLPETVEALITSQIDRLPRDERTLLRFASVLGVGFHESELRAVMVGHPLPTGRDALRRLSYFIRQEGHGRYRFDHQLIRDTAYEGLPYRLRRDLHGRAGEAIESAAPDPDDVAELLSLHYFHAGRPEQSWHYSRRAADRALDKYAFAQAEELLARAVLSARGLRGIAQGELADVNIALAQARVRTGHHTAALAAFRAARAHLRPEPSRAADVMRQESDLYQWLGRHPVALRTVTRALALLQARDDPTSLAVRSRLEGRYSTIKYDQGKYVDALTWAREAERDAQDAGDDEALAEAHDAVQLAVTVLGIEPDRPYGELALALYERLGDKVRQSRSLNNIALQAWVDGKGEEALKKFRRAADLADEVGDVAGAAATRYNVADVLLRQGRPLEAEPLLRDLLPVLKGMGVEDFHAAAHRTLGVCLVLQGRTEEGAALLEQSRAALEALGEAAEVVETDAAIALGALFVGDHERAESLASEAVVRATALDAGYLLPWVLRLRGAALADAGRLDEADDVLTGALGMADAQSRVERGFILSELAGVARARGSGTAADDLAVAAGEAFDLLGFQGDLRYRRD